MVAGTYNHYTSVLPPPAGLIKGTYHPHPARGERAGPAQVFTSYNCITITKTATVVVKAAQLSNRPSTKHCTGQVQDVPVAVHCMTNLVWPKYKHERHTSNKRAASSRLQNTCTHCLARKGQSTGVVSTASSSISTSLADQQALPHQH